MRLIIEHNEITVTLPVQGSEFFSDAAINTYAKIAINPSDSGNYPLEISRFTNFNGEPVARVSRKFCCALGYSPHWNVTVTLKQ